MSQPKEPHDCASCLVRAEAGAAMLMLAERLRKLPRIQSIGGEEHINLSVSDMEKLALWCERIGGQWAEDESKNPKAG